MLRVLWERFAVKIVRERPPPPGKGGEERAEKAFPLKLGGTTKALCSRPMVLGREHLFLLRKNNKHFNATASGGHILFGRTKRIWKEKCAKEGLAKPPLLWKPPRSSAKPTGICPVTFLQHAAQQNNNAAAYRSKEPLHRCGSLRITISTAPGSKNACWHRQCPCFLHAGGFLRGTHWRVPLKCVFSFATSFCTSKKKWHVLQKRNGQDRSLQEPLSQNLRFCHLPLKGEARRI